MQLFGFYTFGFVFSLLLLCVPLALLWRLCPRLLPKAVGTFVGMALQLFVVALLLYAISLTRSLPLFLFWFVAVVLIGSSFVCSRANLSRRLLLVPIAVGQTVAVVVVALYVLLCIFCQHDILDPRWSIAVAGLLLSGVQVTVSPVIKEFYATLQHDIQSYYFLLGNGATHREALMPIVRRAIEKSFSSVLSITALIGLTIFPDALYGMILGGIAPAVAVSYTFAIVAATLAATVIAVLTTLYVADRTTFDTYGRLKNILEK